MATASIPHRWKYDVFVSFRGEDIRKSFVDHLFNDFKQKGIRAFRDDRELPKGEKIASHLHKAIEESRFLIVIFSKKYASSTWCLRELVKILQCKQIENPKHEVRIIFYDAKPDVVRKQQRSYAQAFAKHQVSNRLEVDNWKEALTMAANLSGWDLQDMTNGFESKFISNISNDIFKMLHDGPLHVGENLVGVDMLLDRLNLSRFVGSSKVNMIGICGISGIGKTTLAKAVYNLMHTHFDGSCFCDNVQGVEKQEDLTQVQVQMIVKILKTEDLKIASVAEGAMVIKQRLGCKPILVVLDDVDDHEQLDSLAGSASWFCPGSLIIFTCKDKQLLRSHGVDEILHMDFLDKNQSLQLFSSYAFKTKDCSTGFEEVTEEVVRYVQGHPLALKVLGRFLCGKNVGEWESELEMLKVHPNKEIQQVLRLSYDGLDLQQQNILLDIACLFVGENRDFVASVLDGCNFFADRNMRVLVDKSLITISRNTSLQMHDLIQAMARAIVREESKRLLISSNVYNKVEITEAVEVLILLLEKFSQKVQIDAKDFARMKKLRILKIYQEEKVSERKCELKGHNVIFLGKKLYYLSDELSLFYWHGCPFEYLPSDFYPENIVAIDLSYSNIKDFWTTPKCLRRLKVMKLRYCCNLTTTPDFSEITNLEELDLEGCVNMVTVHPSIGMLRDSLRVLNLSGCSNVNHLPETFWFRCWTSISGFIWKQQHPQRSVSLEGLHMLKCLKELNLEGNNFTSLPGSLTQLSNLQDLYVNGCKKLEVLPELPHSLETVKARGCTSLREVSGSLTQLSNLQKLILDGCKKLEVLPELPHSLETVKARDCTSLCSIKGSNPIMIKRSTYLSNCNAFTVLGSYRCMGSYFRNCPKLFKNHVIDSQVSISETQCRDSSVTSQGSTNRISSFLRYACIQNNICEFFRLPRSSFDGMDIIYDGNSIPNWFTNKSKGNHVKVELSSDWSFSKLRGYGICVVFKRKKPSRYFGYDVINFDGSFLRRCWRDYYKEYFEGKPIRIDESDMIWLHYTTKEIWTWVEAKNFVTFYFRYNEEIEVKECGVRLVCDEDLDDLDVSMFQDLPTLPEHGGAFCLFEDCHIDWSW